MNPNLQANAHELKTLVLSFHPAVTIETVEEERVQALLRSVAVDLMIPLHVWSVTKGLENTANPGGVPNTSEPAKLLKYLKGLEQSGIYLLLDFTKHLSDPTVIRQFREVAQEFQRVRSTIVLTGDGIEMPHELQHLVIPFSLQYPDKEELRQAIVQMLDSIKRTTRIQVNLSVDELDGMLQALSGMTLNQARQVFAYCALSDNSIDADDIRTMTKRKAQLIKEQGALEYFPLEANDYQLGGFKAMKAWLERTRLGFTREAQALNLRSPRGVLIVGVQGCGKSLAAKVIARQWSMPLLKFDVSKLYDKFVGETEKNFRQAIAVAEAMEPSVLWIDEIEKLIVSTGASDADGGLSRRLFGTFLTWLQEHTKQVFVVATANDISAMPPELLRKGRFDEIFFVDLPGDEERREIFRIHLSLRKQTVAAFDLNQLVVKSSGFSGAEIEQVVVGALYRSLYLKKQLDTEVLLAELRYIVPLSVSRRVELNALRTMASQSFVNAS